MHEELTGYIFFIYLLINKILFNQKVKMIDRYSTFENHSEFRVDQVKYPSSSYKSEVDLNESIITKAFQGTRNRCMNWEKCTDSEIQSDEFKVLSLQIPTNESLTIDIKFYPANPSDDIYAIDYKVQLGK